MRNILVLILLSLSVITLAQDRIEVPRKQVREVIKKMPRFIQEKVWDDVEWSDSTALVPNWKSYIQSKSNVSGAPVKIITMIDGKMLLCTDEYLIWYSKQGYDNMVVHYEDDLIIVTTMIGCEEKILYLGPDMRKKKE